MIKEPYNQYEPYTDVVYSLAGYDIDYPETETYPRFSIHKTEVSIHHTLEEAEAKIKKILAEGSLNKRIDKWWGFFISEIPFEVTCHRGYCAQKRWSYDGKGNRVTEKAISPLYDINGNRQIYWGREAEDCPFKVGDLVEVFCRSHVTLGIVYQMPLDFKFTSARLPQTKPEEPLPYHLDDSDDNYNILTLDDDFPDHEDVINCFPAGSLYLDESVAKELRDRFDRLKDEDIFNLSRISIELLDKSFVRYEPYNLTITHRHPLMKGRVALGIDFKREAKYAKEVIIKTYPISEEQFAIDEDRNYIYVLASLLENNVEIIEDAMSKLGFVRCEQTGHLLQDSKGWRWIRLKFELKHPNTI